MLVDRGQNFHVVVVSPPSLLDLANLYLDNFGSVFAQVVTRELSDQPLHDLATFVLD